MWNANKPAISECGSGRQVCQSEANPENEPSSMSEAREKSLAVNVRLKPVDHSNLPHSANYTTVGVAQGIAYVDFGFIEPALLTAIAKTAKDGQAAPNGLEGALVTRVAMGVDLLARLHQQIQQVLVSMRDSRQMKAKG